MLLSSWILWYFEFEKVWFNLNIGNDCSIKLCNKDASYCECKIEKDSIVGYCPKLPPNTLYIIKVM